MSFGKMIHDVYEPNLEAQKKIFNMLCTHWWGLHTIGLHMNAIESNHKHFIIVYEIWCNLYDLSKMKCFRLVNFIKLNIVKESCCHHHKLHGSWFGNNNNAKYIFHRFVWNRHGCHSSTCIVWTLISCTLFKHECHMPIHIV
jgi:hypothetical protein